MSDFAHDHEQKTRLLAEIRTAEADLARLRADLTGRDATIAQQQNEIEAERAARQNFEADAAQLRQTALAYVTSATYEDRERLRAELHVLATVEHPGVLLVRELEAARAVVQQARTGFGTEEDIRRTWAFDPNLLTACIRAYDAIVKASER
jgi:multidrug resistance efflux pump